MRKFRPLIITGFLLVVIYFLLTINCKLGIKCKNCDQYSESIEQSKQKNLFVAEYYPLKKRIKLIHHADTVVLGKIWAEHSWYVDSDICLLQKIEKRTGYNFFIEYDKYPSNIFNFIIEGHGIDGGLEPTRKSGQVEHLLDTMRFEIREKNPLDNIGWKDDLKGETIVFVRSR